VDCLYLLRERDKKKEGKINKERESVFKCVVSICCERERKKEKTRNNERERVWKCSSGLSICLTLYFVLSHT